MSNKKLIWPSASPIKTSLLELVDTKRSNQPIELEMDKEKVLAPDRRSDADRVGAGLFTKPMV